MQKIVNHLLLLFSLLRLRRHLETKKAVLMCEPIIISTPILRDVCQTTNLNIIISSSVFPTLDNCKVSHPNYGFCPVISQLPLNNRSYDK